MKLTKTSIRSRMNNTTLNHSMVIQMATSEVKHFHPDPAIHKWVNGSIRPRRPAFKEGSSRKRLEKHPQAEVEVVEVYEDATATLEPAQEIVVEPEEEEQEEDHIQFNDKGGNEADSE